MTTTTQATRRDFLRTTIAAGAASVVAPHLIPSHVMGAPGSAGANDRIIIGGIGVGGQGASLLNGMNRADDIAVAAVADADMNRSRQVATNLGATAYQDYRRILDRTDVDAVVIASPDHWHALHAIHAAQAGKDVYCEKSLTLTVNEGRRIVDAVRKHNRILQTGSQQRSQARFHRACMLVRNGYLGRLKRIVGVNFAGPWENALPGMPVPDELDWDMWCGPVQPHPYNINVKTSRSHPGWLSIRDFCGGEICGWGTHDIDQIQWALGMDESGPTEIWVEGNPYEPWVAVRPDRRGRFFGAQDPVIHMKYPGDIHVEFSEMRDPNGGALFIGEHGELRVDRGTLDVSNEEWRRLPLEDMPIQLRTANDHHRNWIDCIRTRNRPVADAEIGHRSATACHLGNIARWVSQRIQSTDFVLAWDPVREQCTNNQWANHYLDRPRRKPYDLPQQV